MKVHANAVAILQRFGDEVALFDDQIIQIGSELFVRADVLETTFKASFEYQDAKLTLKAITQQPWPFQLELLRDAKKTSSLSKINEAVEPLYDPGYYFKSPQAIDFLASFRANQIQSEASSYTTNYNVLGRQDIVGLSSRFYFTGDSNDLLNQGTLDFSKYWVNDTAGPLGIKGIQFGDIQAVRASGQASSASRGVSLSNQSQQRETNKETADITGLVQNGWDVELYQNKVLTKQLFDVTSGRYEFLDQNLFSGLNVFEVVKYGPQGQVERETTEKLLNTSYADSLSPTYAMSLTQNNTSLLNIQKTPEEKADNLLFSGRYSMGLNENLSLSFTHANQLGKSDVADQYRLGLTSKLNDRVMLGANYNYTRSQAHALELSIRTSFWQQLLTARTSVKKDDTGTFNRDISHSMSLSMLGSLYSDNGLSIFQQTDVNTGENLNGERSIAFNNRIAVNYSGVSFNHSFGYRRIEDIATTLSENKFGSVNLVSSLGDFFTRVGASYRLDDNFEWESAFINTNWYMFDKLSLRAEITRAFIDENTRYSLGLDWKHDLYAINARIQHSDDYDTSINVSARISFSEAPTEFGYIQNRSSLTSGGTVLVRIYHDVNNNHVYDAEDKPLKNVKVSAEQSRKYAETDVIGIAQLDGLTGFKTTDVLVQKDTIENPLLVHSTFKTSITPRPGLLSLINYPFVEGAEVEGEVAMTDKYGRVRYLANVPLLVLDGHGNQIDSIKSGLDGYYYFSGLVPHRYSLLVDPDYIAAKNFKAPKAIELNVTEQGMQLLDVEIMLEKKDYVEGYIALSGEFSNQQMLRAYYNIVTNRFGLLKANTAVKPFSLPLKNKQFSLGLMFDQNKERVDAFCESVKDRISSCKVSNYTLILDQLGS
jgi:hypothetical protein